MRFQAFTALAYGMKGILYFTYWPYEPLSKTAIVDLKGKPTRLYPIIKRLNGDIRAIGRTLLTLTSTGTYHTGPIPPGATRLPQDAPLQLPNDRPLVLGFFVDPAKTQYALVVNADPHRRGRFHHRCPSRGQAALGPQSQRWNAVVRRASKRQGGVSFVTGDGRLFRLETEFKYPEPKKGIQP